MTSLGAPSTALVEQFLEMSSIHIVGLCLPFQSLQRIWTGRAMNMPTPEWSRTLKANLREHSMPTISGFLLSYSYRESFSICLIGCGKSSRTGKCKRLQVVYWD